MLKQATILAACLVAAQMVLGPLQRSAAGAARNRLEGFPQQIETWESKANVPLDARTVSVLGADDYLNRVYEEATDPPVGLYIGYYEQQRQAATIHSPLNCLPGSGWRIVAHDMVPIDGPGTGRINQIEVRNDVSRLIVLYWYQSHGRVLASEYWSKLYLVLDAVRLHRTDGALVRVTTPVLEWDPNAKRIAERRALRFVEHVFPLLGKYVPA
jgi:EpsI family protein